MQYTVDGQTVSLTKTNFLAQGGEGTVYAKDKTVYKIYHDPSRMIPVAKIKELAAITNPSIIKPEKIIHAKGKAVGYTMAYVQDTYPLCQLFTKAFRQRNGLTNTQVLQLVKKLQEAVNNIHKAKILVVDLNEMNWLVDQGFKNIYGIDVDSYQTPSFPATALMESVRDRHMKSGKFTIETDWFAFAIVSFQMFVGIHPYKGKHASLKTLDERMKANVSVFNKEVGVPKATLPFDVIPDQYKQWYQAVFDRGERSLPPFGDTVAVTTIITQSVSNTIHFTVTVVHKYPTSVRSFSMVNDTSIAFNEDKIFLTKGTVCTEIDRPKTDIQGYCFYGSSAYLYMQNKDSQGVLMNLSTNKIQQTYCLANEVMSYKGRLYLRSSDSIYELSFNGTEFAPIVSQQLVAQVLPHATRLFPGVVVQNLLGTCYASVFPESKTHYQIKLEEIVNAKLIDAKYDNGILIIVIYKDGAYTKIIYSIDKGQIVDRRKIEKINYTGLNFIVMDNGIAVLITEEDKVEIFSRKKIHTVKVVEDQSIDGSSILYTDGSRVLTLNGNELLQLKNR